jgi:pantoate kinase
VQLKNLENFMQNSHSFSRVNGLVAIATKPIETENKELGVPWRAVQKRDKGSKNAPSV